MSDQIVLTMIRPEQFRQVPQRGVRIVESWDRLCAWIAHPIVDVGKDAAGGFVLSDLRDNIRRRAHVISVSAIGIDVDHTTMTPTDAHAVLAGSRHVIYTTHSHEENAPRWRAILPVARPILPNEYAQIWSVVAAQFAAEGIEIDAATKDPCRLWYVPVVRPGAPFVSLVGEGEPLDVDRLLEIATELEAERATVRTSVPARGEIAHADRYIRAAVEKASHAVAAAPDGERNRTLNREVFSLARLEVSESEIESAMLDAARAAGLGEREALRTIASALDGRRRA